MSFSARYGFERKAVHIGNWREAPWSRWSFQHVSEIVPSAVIRAGGHAAEAAHPRAGGAFFDQTVTIEGQASTAAAYLESAETDSFAIAKEGRVVAVHAASHCDIERPHIVFSVSKSLTALIAARLEADGALDLHRTVAHYVPEMASSGYADCSLRHLLDMRAGVDFVESYLDKEGDYARYRSATLWNPPMEGWKEDGILNLLATIPGLKGGEGRGHGHGGAFRYLSPNTDLLGIVLERASGWRYADLLSDLLWRPLGASYDAFVTVDRYGAPRAAGGVSVAALDLLKVGEMLRTGGAVGGHQIVPEAWIADMRANGDRSAWLAGDMKSLFPEGRYRSKWYQIGSADGPFCAIGIHGQWLYVDPKRAVTIVHLCSQTLPLDEPTDHRNLAFYEQVAAAV